MINTGKKIAILSAMLVLGSLALAPATFGETATSPLVLTTFETHPNNLGGDVAVEGDGACDWNDPKAINGWYYSKDLAGFDAANVHEGAQSFRLVNGGTNRPMENWSVFYLLTGPVLDPSTFPVKIKSVDVSGYGSFHFWVKGDKGGERMNVVFRDALAANNFPQARFDPFPEGLKTTWQEVTIPVAQIGKFCDTKQLVMVGVEYGKNLGNLKGNIIYIDEMEFN